VPGTYLGDDVIEAAEIMERRLMTLTSG